MNAKDDAGENALMKAAKEGHIGILKFFISHVSNGSGAKKNPVTEASVVVFSS